MKSFFFGLLWTSIIVLIITIASIGFLNTSYNTYPEPFTIGTKVKFKEGQQEYTVISYSHFKSDPDQWDGYYGMKIGYGEGNFKVVYEDEFVSLEQVKQ